MPEAAELRDLAARILSLALAMETDDQNLLEWLVVRASEYLDEATALEAAPSAAAERKD